MSNELVQIDGHITSTLGGLLEELEKRSDVLTNAVRGIEGLGLSRNGNGIKRRVRSVRSVRKVRARKVRRVPSARSAGSRRLSPGAKVRQVLTDAKKPMNADEIAAAAHVAKRVVWNALSWERTNKRLSISTRDGVKVYQHKA